MSEIMTADRRLESIRHHLEQNLAAAMRIHGKETIWSRYDRLILERGMLFFGRVRSQDNPLLRVWSEKNSPRKKECFANAQMFVLDSASGHQAVYHEGYALGLHVPFAHGWSVLEDGSVVDFTLDVPDDELTQEEVEAEPAEQMVYLGVPVPTDVVKAHVTATLCYERLAH